MQDDHELRRRGQAGAGEQADRARLREVRPADGAARRPARAVPGLLRLSQVQEREGRRRRGQPAQARYQHRLREMRGADEGSPWPARTLPRLQRLPEMPQHQAASRGPEGEAQDAAARAAEEGGAAGGNLRNLPGVRRSDETAPEPPRFLPWLRQVSEVQGHMRGAARSARAGPGNHGLSDTNFCASRSQMGPAFLLDTACAKQTGARPVSVSRTPYPLRSLTLPTMIERL